MFKLFVSLTKWPGKVTKSHFKKFKSFFYRKVSELVNPQYFLLRLLVMGGGCGSDDGRGTTNNGCG